MLVTARILDLFKFLLYLTNRLSYDSRLTGRSNEINNLNLGNRMKLCLNCDERAPFTVAACGVDTGMCQPCFDVNSECCEWCDRRGASDDMQRHEVVICSQCVEDAQKQGCVEEDEYYASLVWCDEAEDYIEPAVAGRG